MPRHRTYVARYSVAREKAGLCLSASLEYRLDSDLARIDAALVFGVLVSSSSKHLTQERQSRGLSHPRSKCLRSLSFARHSTAPRVSNSAGKICRRKRCSALPPPAPPAAPPHKQRTPKTRDFSVLEQQKRASWLRHEQKRERRWQPVAPRN